MPATKQKRRPKNTTTITKDPFSDRNDTHPSANKKSHPYICVHCHTPCPALYRRLSVSFASSIQAMTCDSCGRVVDPYMEQEPLLVVIDCILSRTEAYRHVLHNDDELKTLPTTRIVQLVVGWSIVNSYLLWQARTTNTDYLLEKMNQELHQNALLQLVPLVLSSLGGILFQWCIMSLLQRHETKAETGFRIKLFWAVFLPCSFTAVVIFVSIWENAKAVRMLGTLLISYWQGTATWVVTQNLSTPILCLLGGIIWRVLLSLLFPDEIGCVGYELSFLGNSLCIT